LSSGYSDGCEKLVEMMAVLKVERKAVVMVEKMVD
jgi:hypothetical protein